MEAGEGSAAPADDDPDPDPGDLGPADDTHAEPAHSLIEPTQTLTPAVRVTVIDGGVHHLPTQQLPRRTGGETHTKYSTASPAEALRLEELARTQIFLKVAIVTCIGGIG